jgi:DNA-binding MarR family transcriptional regulator
VESPDAEQFEELYGRLWQALRRREAADLAQHELQLLHHVPQAGVGPVSLQYLARQLGMPKSTASALVKDLERRGFLRRARNPNNERELAIELTAAGAERVAADTLLEPSRLAAAMSALNPKQRRRILKSLERLVVSAEAVAAPQAESVRH